MNTFGMMLGVLVVGNLLPIMHVPMPTHYNTAPQPVSPRVRNMPAIRVAVKSAS